MSAASTRIDLLRHGECVGGDIFRGSTDCALSAAGWRQMEAAVADLAWEQIIASPLRRCRRFAEHLGQRLGVPVRLDDDWRECHFGAWEGRLRADLWAAHPAVLQRYFADPSSYTPAGGEPYSALALRVARAWQNLIAAHCGKRVLVIAHGGTLCALYLHLLALPAVCFTRFAVPYACLSRWLCYPQAPERPVLIFHNRGGDHV